MDPTTGLKNERFMSNGSRVCGARVATPAELRSLDWATNSCPLAWSLRAIWRPRGVVSDIPSVARSSLGDVVACGYKPVKIKLGAVTDAVCAKEDTARRYNLVASRLMGPAAKLNKFKAQEGSMNSLGVLDDSQGPYGLTKLSIDTYSAAVLDVHTIKLFRFPAVGVPSAAFLRDGFMTGSAGMPGRGPATRPAWYEAFPRAVRGHASKVAAVAFTPDDLWLLSAGGSDCAVFQWRHVRPLHERWWISRSAAHKAMLLEELARVIPRTPAESAAIPETGLGLQPAGGGGWQSEAHYVTACFQKAMLELVGFSVQSSGTAAPDNLLRQEVLQRLTLKKEELFKWIKHKSFYDRPAALKLRRETDRARQHPWLNFTADIHASDDDALMLTHPGPEPELKTLRDASGLDLDSIIQALATNYSEPLVSRLEYLLAISEEHLAPEALRFWNHVREREREKGERERVRGLAALKKAANAVRLGSILARKGMSAKATGAVEGGRAAKLPRAVLLEALAPSSTTPVSDAGCVCYGGGGWRWGGEIMSEWFLFLGLV